MMLPIVRRRYEFIQQLAAQLAEERLSREAVDAELAEARLAREALDAELNALKRTLITKEEERRHTAQLLAEEVSSKEDLEGELLECTTMLEDYLRQLVDLNERSHNSFNSVASSEAEQRRLEAKILELREEIACARADALAASAKEHEREVSRAKEHERRALDTEALLVKMAGLQSQVEDLRGENAALEKRLAEAQSELNQEKLSRAKEALISRKSNVALDGQMAQQEAAILGYESRLTTLSGNLDAARAELASAQARLAEREQDLQSVQNAYTSLTQADADQALDELMEVKSKKTIGRKARSEASAAALAKRTTAVDQLKLLANHAQPGSTRSLFNALGAALQPDFVCDIGTGDSPSTQYRAAFKQAEFVVFEPSKTKIDALQNSNQNNSDSRFEPLVVADRGGEAIYFDVVGGQGGLRPRLKDAAPRSRKVKIVSLDEYFTAELAENRRFMLWIEAEGAPDMVLKGARKVLRTTLAVRFKANKEPIWDKEVLAPAMIELMQDAGFVLMGEDPAAQTIFEGRVSASDMIFLNNRWLELIVEAAQAGVVALEAEVETPLQA